MIKNIIFDFDGVIGDSEILVSKAFSRYLGDQGFFFSEEEFAAHAGKKTIQIIEEISKKFNIKDQDKFFNDIMDIANYIYSNDLTAISGVENFLKITNFNIFIGSNSIKKRILSGLNKIKLDKYFPENKIFSFDTVGVPKPNPDIYLAAIKSNNLNKDETIIIEDSAIGVQAGVAANIKVLGLTAGGHWFPQRSQDELYSVGAFKVVKNYIEVLNEIKKL